MPLEITHKETAHPHLKRGIVLDNKTIPFHEPAS